MSESNNQSRRVLLTAALPYSNGRLHVGHLAGAYLPADIFCRFLRLRGADVRFVCGSDDHGVAIMLTAEKEGSTPAEIATRYQELQANDFKGMGIEFDIYDSTSRNPYHKKASQDFFKSLYDRGYFEKETSRQFFDSSRDMFLPDRYVKGTCGYCDTPDQNGDQCENCGKVLDVDHLKDAVSVVSGSPAEIKETVHWFLDLSRFSNEVEEWIDSAELRDHTRNFVKGLLGAGLVKRSMTRDLDWGIPVPLDDPEAEGKVLYVWFDAPIGYVSNTMLLCEEREQNSDNYKEWWKSNDTEIYHFIGEDNTIFHCVIWIAMLRAEGTFNLPKAVVVNQFLNLQGASGAVEKFSKSRGNALWLGDYLADGNDPDMLRYYLTAIAPEKARTIYNPIDLIQRNNSDLANTLGNFINRIVSFSVKNFGSEIPVFEEKSVTEADLKFRNTMLDCFKRTTEQLEACQFKGALETIMDFCRSCNKYVDDKAPWVTKKTDEQATRVTLYYALQAIKFLGVVLSPFIPGAAGKIQQTVSLVPGDLTWEKAIEPSLPGTLLQKPEILFKKIELPESE